MSSAVVPTPSGSAAGSQEDSGGAGGGSGLLGGSRNMRLKVTYTFGDENNSNCLARWPHLVSTPVVQVDRETLVGAVELKTCILNMISSSPELVATLGQDYSVYAYDYSEPGIPLVGCGMLSWAMTAVNSPNDAFTPSRLMITGRVCSNMFGFFSNDGVKETLEVRLRLTPVKTFSQAQFVQSVHTYTALSKIIPGGFDASAWSTYLNANPKLLDAGSPQGLFNTVSRSTDTPTLANGGTSTVPVPQGHHQRSSLSQQWRDINTTSAEEGQPPKKKARPNAKRPRKQNNGGGGSRKKSTQAATTVGPTPVAIPLADEIPSVSSQLPVALSQASPTMPPIETAVTMSRQSSIPPQFTPTPIPEMSFSPSLANSPPRTVDSAMIASSPPTQSDESVEETRTDFSPDPTSPILPSLPPTNSTEGVHRNPDVLFEDIKEEAGSPLDPIRIQSTQKMNMAQPSSALVLPRPMPSTIPDDATMSAAPSPDPSPIMTKPKPTRKRSYPRKPKAALTSDAIASSEVGDEMSKPKRARTTSISTSALTIAKIDRTENTTTKPPSLSKSRTAAHVRERIEMQLLEAVKEGKMPNYCMNCGAIETPTWRKATIDQEGDGEGDKKKDREVLLCNPCGIWHASHKTMRPQEYWDGKKEEPSKKPRTKKRKGPPATPAPEVGIHQPSEPCMEPIVVPDEDEIPRQAPLTATRHVAMTPRGDRSASRNNSEWEAATRASTRNIQSSPILQGSAMSPIDLDGLESDSKSPRRILFPRARDSTEFGFLSKKIQGEKQSRQDSEETEADGVLVRQVGKENLVPVECGGLQTSTETQTPITPSKCNLAPPLQPKTPSRSPPKNGVLGTSQWNAKMFPPTQSVALQTPERRLVKSHAQRISLSPNSELLEKLLAAEVLPNNQSTAKSPPVINLPGFSGINQGVNFDLDNEDLFSTDLIMPSSPPFNLYEDPAGVVDIGTSSGLWSDFLPSSPELGMEYGLDAFNDFGAASNEFKNDDNNNNTAGSRGLMVDFSAYIDDITKHLNPLPAAGGDGVQVVAGSEEPME